MARKEDLEGCALADFGIAIDEAAGLLDDAIDHRKAKTGAFADFLGGEEWFEDFLKHIGRNASAIVCNFKNDIIGFRQVSIVELCGF